ncbi:MAG: hypothetical protein EON95_00390 [Caulobacteraceae bacterium]|nr:MAG: hypothetical protein EON95_00390 [Caulobacteraceae bacterium]
MRLLFVALAALAVLVATPAAAACGSAAGRTYSGNAVWDGGGTYNIELTLRADCTLTYVIYMGSTQQGTWSQSGNRVTFDLPALDIHYAAELGGQTLDGTMTTGASRGRFSFVARDSGRVCGQGIAGMPDPSGLTYVGQGRYNGGQAFDMAARLNRDCSVTIFSDGREISAGTWSQMMGMVTFTTSDIGATYTGTLTGPGTGLVGSMDNGAGSVGTFSFKRKD